MFFQLVSFVKEYVWHKVIFIWYSMRLELTLVSSINDSWLVKLVYIGVVIPLSCSVFTLVWFIRLWYLYVYSCVCVCVCVCWLWSDFGFHKQRFGVRVYHGGFCGFRFTGSSFFFFLYIYTYVYVCVSFESFLSSENMFRVNVY